VVQVNRSCSASNQSFNVAAPVKLSAAEWPVGMKNAPQLKAAKGVRAAVEPISCLLGGKGLLFGLYVNFRLHSCKIAQAHAPKVNRLTYFFCSLSLEPVFPKGLVIPSAQLAYRGG
jgi:hypothetical protein